MEYSSFKVALLMFADSPIVSTPIILQAVSQDGVTLQGEGTILLDHNGAADQGVVEAPCLLHSGSTYILFFSSGCFTTGNYTVSYATSNSINGPYTRMDRPLFMTGDYGLEAPGGMSIHADGEHMVFHARYGSGRVLYPAVISFRGNKVGA